MMTRSDRPNLPRGALRQMEVELLLDLFFHSSRMELAAVHRGILRSASACFYVNFWAGFLPVLFVFVLLPRN